MTDQEIRKTCYEFNTEIHAVFIVFKRGHTIQLKDGTYICLKPKAIEFLVRATLSGNQSSVKVNGRISVKTSLRQGDPLSTELLRW